MKVVDVYCGIGGFSAGALLADHEVVLGIDNCPNVLKCFAANTKADARCLTLPATVVWPTGNDMHFHFSPPCTALSRARAGQASAEQVGYGLAHVKWALNSVIEENFKSFSLETVSVPATRALIQTFKERFPSTIEFDTFECADFGVPQTRKRIFVGRPEMIKRLQSVPVSARVSVRDVFTELPANFFKNTTVQRGGKGCIRSVEEPGFTVCGARSLSWCDSTGKTFKCMTARELAVIQTLPPEWRLPTRKRDATLAVGNSVPSEMAREVCRAAAGDASLTQISEPVSGTSKRLHSEAFMSLETRIAALEAHILAYRHTSMAYFENDIHFSFTIH